MEDFPVSLFLFIILRIQFFCTFRTNNVTKFCLRVVSDIDIYLFPVTVIIAYFLTRRANRQHVSQGLDCRKCISQLNNKPLPL